MANRLADHYFLFPGYSFRELANTYRYPGSLNPNRPRTTVAYPPPDFLNFAWTAFARFQRSESTVFAPYLALSITDDPNKPPHLIALRQTAGLAHEPRFWTLELPPYKQRLPLQDWIDMYSSTKKWIAPEKLKADKLKKLNFSRSKLCKNSEAWPLDFDVQEHTMAYAKDVWDHKMKNVCRQVKEWKEREQMGLPGKAPSNIGPAFPNKRFDTNMGSVLGQPTVFCPGYDKERYHVMTFHGDGEKLETFKVNKELADWPEREEAKYEGDDRISTDPLHGRFLGLPRVPGNHTVNWMQRSVVKQYPMDDFFTTAPDADDIFWRFHTCEYMEVDDDEGRQLIGDELMDMLSE